MKLISVLPIFYGFGENSVFEFPDQLWDELLKDGETTDDVIVDWDEHQQRVCEAATFTVEQDLFDLFELKLQMKFKEIHQIPIGIFEPSYLVEYTVSKPTLSKVLKLVKLLPKGLLADVLHGTRISEHELLNSNIDNIEVLGNGFGYMLEALLKNENYDNNSILDSNYTYETVQQINVYEKNPDGSKGKERFFSEDSEDFETNIDFNEDFETNIDFNEGFDEDYYREQIAQQKYVQELFEDCHELFEQAALGNVGIVQEYLTIRRMSIQGMELLAKNFDYVVFFKKYLNVEFPEKYDYNLHRNFSLENEEYIYVCILLIVGFPLYLAEMAVFSIDSEQISINHEGCTCGLSRNNLLSNEHWIKTAIENFRNNQIAIGLEAVHTTWNWFPKMTKEEYKIQRDIFLNHFNLKLLYRFKGQLNRKRELYTNPQKTVFMECEKGSVCAGNISFYVFNINEGLGILEKIVTGKTNIQFIKDACVFSNSLTSFDSLDKVQFLYRKANKKL